jgi:hypothetical protein
MPAAMASKNSPVVVMSIGIAVSTVGTGFFLAFAGGSDSAGPAAMPPPAQVVEASLPTPIPAPPPVAVAEPAPGGETKRAVSRPNRMTRDVKREQIWSALAREHKFQPAAPGSAAPDKEVAAELPIFDPQYIRSVIDEQLTPIAKECYESALADDPKLAGTLFAEFSIIGVEGVGGVVEDSAIVADRSTLDSEFVRECIRESMMAVTFEAPPDGGYMPISYEFEFSPEG